MLCEDNTVAVLPGYWRASTSTYVVARCVADATACAGGAGAANALCRRGYRGPLCSACADGYGKVGEACVPCGSQGVSWVVVLLMVGGVVFFLYVVIRATTGAGDKHDTTSATVKITWTYLQCLYYIGRISADWSSNSSAFFASIVRSSP
jgi:hypothetical protein